MRPQSTATATIDRTGVVAVVAIGAIVATLCDASHVLTGTISYGPGARIGQPWWVLPEFALSFFAMSTGYVVVSAGLSSIVATTQSRTPGSARAFVVALLAFVLVYLGSGLASQQPALLSWVFYLAFLLRLAMSYERAWLLILALLMASGGMLGEGLVASAGLAAYRHADVFHVPLWLGGLYMHGAFALRESMRCLAYRSGDPAPRGGPAT